MSSPSGMGFVCISCGHVPCECEAAPTAGNHWSTHPHTCSCMDCEAQREKMRTPGAVIEVKCIRCSDTGWVYGTVAGEKPTKPCPDCQPQYKGRWNPKLTPDVSYAADRVKDPWKHRSSNMVCVTCMWNVAKGGGQSMSDPTKKQLGRCRRHAPTMDGYPVVFADDWCGDHKLDETKV